MKRTLRALFGLVAVSVGSMSAMPTEARIAQDDARRSHEVAVSIAEQNVHAAAHAVQSATRARKVAQATGDLRAAVQAGVVERASTFAHDAAQKAHAAQHAAHHIAHHSSKPMLGTDPRTYGPALVQPTTAQSHQEVGSKLSKFEEHLNKFSTRVKKVKGGLRKVLKKKVAMVKEKLAALKNHHQKLKGHSSVGDKILLHQKIADMVNETKVGLEGIDAKVEKARTKKKNGLQAQILAMKASLSGVYAAHDDLKTAHGIAPHMIVGTVIPSSGH